MAAAVPSENLATPGRALTQLIQKHEHLVHFYDDDEELARTVGSYLRGGLADGAAVVVIATAPHRQAFAGELRRGRRRLQAVQFLDAAETLARLMPDGRLDRAAFEKVIGGTIRAAGGGTRPVLAYGEMVALLWEAGDVGSALELEMLWNELADEVSFSLLCAYRSASVGTPEHTGALGEVCRLHSATLTAATRAFAPTTDAPAAARHFLSNTLRTWGQCGPGAADAALVMSELATNAVVHTDSPFTVLVRTDGSRLRLEVSDPSLRQPVESAQPPEALSGRGLHVVAMLARDWGVQNRPDGKTVWAELPIAA
jgi:anti-sigma regulatory factor (Ser/Thr protein kinase)